ncbi:MAG: hypothetical protein SGILL_006331 [Bacillariaceae sp.]
MTDQSSTLPRASATTSAPESGDSLAQIQSECSEMMSMMKNLENEEHNLDCQLEILAREAMMCGFQPDKVEKVLLRRPPTSKKKKAPSKAPPVTSAAVAVNTEDTSVGEKAALKTEDTSVGEKLIKREG